MGLGMADLREGKDEAAIARFNTGAEQCPFAAQRKYFLTALFVARLRKSREDALEIEKAEADLEKLKPAMTLSSEIIARARLPIDRMLEISARP